MVCTKILSYCHFERSRKMFYSHHQLGFDSAQPDTYWLKHVFDSPFKERAYL